MMKLFTSESVTEGHPDKVCDQISDAVLDAYFSIDPNSRVACECSVSNRRLLIMGEITSKATVDIEKIAREKILEIGYDKDEYLFNGNNVDILIDVHNQSADIALGVDNSKESKENIMEDTLGAGDQGMMFGYATNEIEDVLMPAAIYYAHKLAKRLTEVRKEGIINYLRPDGKTQITAKYDDNNKFVGIDTIVVSSQHDDNILHEKIEKDIIEHVIKVVIPQELMDNNTKIYVNPTGNFVIGGPAGDSGLTGRKIIVDTYGGYAPHGGGAFSGKDPTKVDRSAAYYARYVAKHIVALGLADKCEIQVAYAIGVAKPVSINVNTFGTNKIDESKILELIYNVFDFRPANIIKELNLRTPVYGKTAAYGHFGHNEYSWERLNKLEECENYIKGI
ncbi:MAG: methionine adenosyltransferase [Clostridia bacterium]|nr:methionine adenosyltransferase [Clostridia bacterium]